MAGRRAGRRVVGAQAVTAEAADPPQELPSDQPPPAAAADEAEAAEAQDAARAALTGAQHVPLPLRVLAVAALLAPQVVVLAVQGAAPLLLREAPLVLLALHPFAPWSLLVSTRTDPAAFVAVIVAVRTIPSLGGYFVGRWYGTRALDWLARNPRTRRATVTAQRVSARFGAALLVVYPGATSSVLAGVNGMPMRRFVPLTLTGLTLAALLARVLATAAAGPLIIAASFADRYAIPLGAVLLVGVVVSQLVQRRRRAD